MPRQWSRRRLLTLLAAGAVTLACGESGDNVTEAVTVAAPSEPTPTRADPQATAGVQTPRVLTPSSATPSPATPSPVTPPPVAPSPGLPTPDPNDPDAALRRLEGYGFQAHIYNQDRDFIVGKTLDAGFNWLKQQVEWSQTEPIEKGGYDWRELDKVVAAVASAGLNLLLSVVRAPGWALGEGAHGPPADPQDFEDFMRTISSRYRGAVQAYELWNEANLSREWGYGRINAGGFVDLLLAGRRGVRAGDPAAVTIGGALTPAGDVDIPDQQVQAVDDVSFLRRMYEYNDGIVRDGFDAWGIHPGGFNNAPRQEIGSPRGDGWNGHASFYFQRFTQHRAVMEEFGDGAKPIWITEFGWSTANQDPAYGYGVDNSEADQAEFLVDAIRLVREQYDYITHAFVWNLNFQSVVGPEDEKFPFGVLRPDGTPRPSYEALAVMHKGAA